VNATLIKIYLRGHFASFSLNEERRTSTITIMMKTRRRENNTISEIVNI
jgi:hypothetical protein